MRIIFNTIIICINKIWCHLQGGFVGHNLSSSELLIAIKNARGMRDDFTLILNYQSAIHIGDPLTGSVITLAFKEKTSDKSASVKTVFGSPC